VIDVEAAYAEGLPKLHEAGERYDSHLLHIGGDLAGMCARNSWARRRYETVPRRWDSLTRSWVHPHPELEGALPEPQSIVAMQLGFKVEELVLDALEAGREGWDVQRNVPCALILTEEGLQGRVFEGDDAHGAMIDFASGHENTAVGHIDAILSGQGQLVVIDVKSTVWQQRYDGGQSTWQQRYGPKESHVFQVSAYALAVSLACPGANVSAGLFELDLGGKDHRWSQVDWKGQWAAIRSRMLECVAVIDPRDEIGPPAVPAQWTHRKGGESWACGSISNGKLSRAYCGLTSCPSHVLSVGGY
jgi:hypothetical protein